MRNFKEIAAFEDNYAGLDYDNQIYTWINDEEPKLLDSDLRGIEFSGLKIGEEFGHILDSNLNLYGWGNNQFGELGTGDSYPRLKLT